MESFLIFAMVLILMILVVAIISLESIKSHRKGYNSGRLDGFNEACDIVVKIVKERLK
jgi:hypothetical protein